MGCWRQECGRTPSEAPTPLKGGSPDPGAFVGPNPGTVPRGGGPTVTFPVTPFFGPDLIKTRMQPPVGKRWATRQNLTLRLGLRPLERVFVVELLASGLAVELPVDFDASAIGPSVPGLGLAFQNC